MVQTRHRPWSVTVRAAGATAVVLTALAVQPGQALAAPGTEAQVAAATGWILDGYGPGNTSYNPQESELNRSAVADLTARWSGLSPRVTDSCAEQSPPLAADGRVYVTDEAGVTVYDADSGETLWHRPNDSPVETLTPILALAGSRLLLTDTYCRSASDPTTFLIAVDARTGEQLWRVRRDVPIWEMVVDGDVVVGSGEDTDGQAVTAYRVSDGEELWTRDGRMYEPVSSQGRVLVQPYADAAARAANQVPASELVDITTGETVWSSSTRWTAQAAAGDALYALAGDRVARLDADSGDVVWSVTSEATSWISVDDTQVYVVRGSDLAAYDARTGEQNWYRVFDATLGKPVVAGGVLYSTISGAYVDALNPANGRNIVDELPFQRAVGHPVVVDGWLYATDGRVLDAYAIG